MIDKRMRSPGYPSTSLKEAIEIAGKVFSDARTNPIDREVAVQSMGYSGITGRSGKVLSNLIQYGLLQKAGKNEVAVTPLAVEILHPDNPESKALSIVEAAYKPDLFQELSERFPGTVPAENVLRSYLLKRGFTDIALPPAIRAYSETCLFAEQFRDYDGQTTADGERAKSIEDQSDEVFAVQDAKPYTRPTNHKSPANNVNDGPQFNVVSMSRIVLSGSVCSTADADRVIEFMTAMKALLPEALNKVADNGGHHEE